MALRPSLGIVVHADAKVGKTWLVSTAPKPLVVLDAEGGARYMDQIPHNPRLRVIEWDPQKSGPPSMKDADVALVFVRGYDTVLKTYSHLANRDHPFRSAAIDTLTETQKRCLDGITGGPTLRPEQSHWGDLYREVEDQVRKWRDLTFHPTHPLDCVVMTTHSVEHHDKAWPLVKGQLIDTLPGMPDVIGYLHVAANKDGKIERRLAIQPVLPKVLAGDRTHVLSQTLGAIVVRPNLSRMVAILRGEEQTTKETDAEVQPG